MHFSHHIGSLKFVFLTFVVIIFDLKECPFLKASVQIVGLTSKKVDDF